MFDIPPDDADTFQRHLQRDEIPEKYLKYYRNLAYMVHQETAGGPLGPIWVAHCLLACGFEPKLPTSRTDMIDWEKVTRGTRLEAFVNERWLPGAFMFYGEHKVACIKFDHDDEVKEVPRFQVRMPQGKPLELPPEPVQDETADVLDNNATDWTTAVVGEEVWAEIEGETRETTFVSVTNDGSVVVLLDGVEHLVESHNATRASEAVA